MYLIISAVLAAGDPLPTTFLSEGMTKKTGGYTPSRAEMNEKADILKKAPEGLKDAKYGYLSFGDKKFAFILNEPAEGDATLYVDSNADGEITDSEKADWSARTMQGNKQYNGKTKVKIDEDKMGAVNMYRFDPKDQRRKALANTLLYYADFGQVAKLTIDGQTFDIPQAGKIGKNAPIWLDRDKNGMRSSNYEMVKLGQPFNFTGTTYMLDVEDGKLTLAKADKELPKTPMPPSFKVGDKALAFSGKSLDGKDVEFPKSFAGKLVMLDCWATWCGPCIGEIPHMKEAYKEHHEKGFEILGVSFDNPDMEEKLNEFLKEKEITWQQVYEGKGWKNQVAGMYDVNGIPFVLLVDGDTGKIVATERSLRGPGLKEFIGKKLEEKADKGSSGKDGDRKGG